MQSAQSIGRALYRIVFRGGTPQRIRFSTPLLLSAVVVAVSTAVLSGRLFFELSAIEIGLGLFTILSGLYIGTALLSRTVPAARLRATLTTILLLLAAAGVLLSLLIPLQRILPASSMAVGAVVLAAVISGTSNALHFARGGSRRSAVLLTMTSTVILAAFYGVLRWLLRILYA